MRCRLCGSSCVSKSGRYDASGCGNFDGPGCGHVVVLTINVEEGTAGTAGGRKSEMKK